MILGINFCKPITVPTRKGTLSFYNAKADGDIQAEETPLGFTLHVGKTAEGKFVPDGRTVRVPWHMVEYVTEQNDVKTKPAETKK